jgi:hypothetical protein
MYLGMFGELLIPILEEEGPMTHSSTKTVGMPPYVYIIVRTGLPRLKVFMEMDWQSWPCYLATLLL